MIQYLGDASIYLLFAQSQKVILEIYLSSKVLSKDERKYSFPVSEHFLVISDDFLISGSNYHARKKKVLHNHLYQIFKLFPCINTLSLTDIHVISV